MTYIVNNASLSMYADDHQLYVKGNSVDCVEQLLTKGGGGTLYQNGTKITF